VNKHKGIRAKHRYDLTGDKPVVCLEIEIESYAWFEELDKKAGSRVLGYSGLGHYLAEAAGDHIKNLEWVFSQVRATKYKHQGNIRHPDWFDEGQAEEYERCVKETDLQGFERLHNELEHDERDECPACKMIRLIKAFRRSEDE